MSLHSKVPSGLLLSNVHMRLEVAEEMAVRVRVLLTSIRFLQPPTIGNFLIVSRLRFVGQLRGMQSRWVST